MCSKIISDVRAIDETNGNDLLLRGSVSGYCRRAPGREIERVKKLGAWTSVLEHATKWWSGFLLNELVCVMSKFVLCGPMQNTNCSWTRLNVSVVLTLHGCDLERENDTLNPNKKWKKTIGDIFSVCRGLNSSVRILRISNCNITDSI